MRLTRKIQQDRRTTVERYGSPTFRHVFGILGASGGREYIELRGSIPASLKYLPMDAVTIFNRATEALLLEINGLNFVTMPGLFTLPIVDEAIWSLALINNDPAATATTAGEVEAVFQRRARNADSAARENR